MRSNSPAALFWSEGRVILRFVLLRRANQQRTALFSVHPFTRKISRCADGQITFTSPRHPVPPGGALAIATNAGQGAVAAHPAAWRAREKRTAKSCGPDAPTLASRRQ